MDRYMVGNEAGTLHEVGPLGLLLILLDSGRWVEVHPAMARVVTYQGA